MIIDAFVGFYVYISYLRLKYIRVLQRAETANRRLSTAHIPSHEDIHNVLQRAATANGRLSTAHIPSHEDIHNSRILIVQHRSSRTCELKRQHSDMQGSSEYNYQVRKCP
jgi:hypothetical protein